MQLWFALPFPQDVMSPSITSANSQRRRLRMQPRVCVVLQKGKAAVWADGRTGRGDCGSRLTQCSRIAKIRGSRQWAPTSRRSRSCVQGLEAHARPSKLTVHPSLGSPFTYAIRAGFSHRACQSNCSHFSFFRQIVASSTTALWTGSDKSQDGALRVQQEC